MKKLLAAILIACVSIAHAQTFVRQGGAIYDGTTGAYIGNINLLTGKEERLTATLGSGLSASAVICTDAAKAFTSTCTSATPSFGATTVTGLTVGTGTLAIAAAKAAVISNSLTFAGTDSTTMTFPATSASIARTDAANTFTGTQTFSGQATSTKVGGGSSSGVYANGAGNTSVALRDSTQALDAKLWDFSVGVDANTLRARVLNDAENSAISWLVVTRSGATVSNVASPFDFLVGSNGSVARLRTTQQVAPTCSSNCGTSPSIAGTDTSGIVTMGASGVPASGWVITFNGTWSAAPSCIVQPALATMVVGKMPIAVVVTTTTVTVTTNGTAPSTSDKYSYHCIGVS